MTRQPRHETSNVWLPAVFGHRSYIHNGTTSLLLSHSQQPEIKTLLLTSKFILCAANFTRNLSQHYQHKK